MIKTKSATIAFSFSAFFFTLSVSVIVELLRPKNILSFGTFLGSFSKHRPGIDFMLSPGDIHFWIYDDVTF